METSRVLTVIEQADINTFVGQIVDIRVPLPFTRLGDHYEVANLLRFEVSPFYLVDPLIVGAFPRHDANEEYGVSCHHLPHGAINVAAMSLDCFLLREVFYTLVDMGGARGYETISVDFPGGGYLIPADHFLVDLRWMIHDMDWPEVGNEYSFHLTWNVKIWYKMKSVSVTEFEGLRGMFV